MATTRQQKAVKNLVGNGGNVTQAMRDANYSEATINTPQKLTESKGFQELWEEVIPDKLLTKVHKEGLEAGRTIYKNNNATGTVDEVGYEPDYAVRHKYLDSAYKLKGSYAPEKSVSLNIDITQEAEAKANEIINRFLNGNSSNSTGE